MRSEHRIGKRNLAFAVLAMLFCLSFGLAQDPKPFSVNESPLAAPTGFINDYAGVIDAQTKSRLEKRLTDLKGSTNPPVEIAVAVVRTTGGRDIFDYSLAVARGWKIGSKADDNPGALLLVAIDDRKYFTQVSKDLEDELPDGVVGGLQRQNLVPEFKKGNYAKGISDTIEAYIAAIESHGTGATPPPAKARQQPSSDSEPSVSGVVCCGLIILFIILMIFIRSNRGGGGGGGGIADSALPWVIGSILSGSGGSSGSSSSDWGGSSDGGFGGFGGGGDFGGGGAGGDW